MYEAEVYDWKPSTQTQTDADTDTGTDTDTDTDTDTHTHTWLLSDVTLSRHPRKFGYGIGKWIAEGKRARQRQGQRLRQRLRQRKPSFCFLFPSKSASPFGIFIKQEQRWKNKNNDEERRWIMTEIFHRCGVELWIRIRTLWDSWTHFGVLRQWIKGHFWYFINVAPIGVSQVCAEFWKKSGSKRSFSGSDA